MLSPTALLVLGDCLLDPRRLTLPREAIICADPSYGINYKVNARAFVGRGSGLKDMAYTATEERAPVAGDDRPFDPSPWLVFPRVALCGANYYADRLPTDRQWVVWDKRDGSASDDHSDAELVWCSTRGPLRIHRQKWRGVVRAGEENCSRQKKHHPNQKPVALIDRLLTLLDAKEGDLVVDPYMGSGSTGVAAIRRGCDFIGWEIDPAHYQTAAERIAAEGIGLVVLREVAA